MKIPKFESLKEGDEIPTLKIQSVSRHTLALYCGASGDHNPIHVDLDYAKSVGLEDVIAHGMLSAGYLGRMLTNWVPQSTIRSIKNRFTAMTHIGDSITCTGKVTEKFEKENEKLVRIEMQAHTPNSQTIIAEAVIALE
ncbi:MAG: dehydratase [Deltaproteobacteria bacterium]|nr:dehydratase [Deltaproteobacteria bacterium]|tara:strand:- start:1786 stop:2202 length:417 start_codon:yes stop_codon:yes gene_type:complete